MEGCYIPFDWKKDFEEEYLAQIRYYCLVMTREYIESCYAEIAAHANDVECRLDDSDLSMECLIQENRRNLELCRKYDCEVILIDKEYNVTL